MSMDSVRPSLPGPGWPAGHPASGLGLEPSTRVKRRRAFGRNACKSAAFRARRRSIFEPDYGPVSTFVPLEEASYHLTDQIRRGKV